MTETTMRNMMIEVMTEAISPFANILYQMQEDVSGLKEDVSELKEDVSELKEDVSELKEDNRRLNQRMTNLELIIENDIRKSLSTLADGQIDIFRRLDVLETKVDRLDRDNDVIKIVVSSNSQDIQVLQKRDCV